MRGIVLGCALVVGGTLGGCGAGGGPPPTDACAMATPGSVDAVDLAAAGPGDLAGMPSPFVPLADGDGVPLIRGSQGAYMIGVMLRVSGAQAPDCLMQRTVVTSTSGDKVTSASPPLRTYLQPDGTRTTHPLWLPADYPMQFVVDVDAADQALERHLHLVTQ